MGAAQSAPRPWREALEGGKDGCEGGCDSESKRMEVAIHGWFSASPSRRLPSFFSELIMSCTTIILCMQQLRFSF